MGYLFFFFVNDTATTEIYTVSDTLSLHDALPICISGLNCGRGGITRALPLNTKRSEEHTSELQSPDTNSYAVFCLKKKKENHTNQTHPPHTPHPPKHTHPQTH